MNRTATAAVCAAAPLRGWQPAPKQLAHCASALLLGAVRCNLEPSCGEGGPDELLCTVLYQNSGSTFWNGCLEATGPTRWLESMLSRCFPDGGGAAALLAAVAEGRPLVATFQAAPFPGSYASLRAPNEPVSGAPGAGPVWHKVVITACVDPSSFLEENSSPASRSALIVTESDVTMLKEVEEQVVSPSLPTVLPTPSRVLPAASAAEPAALVAAARRRPGASAARGGAGQREVNAALLPCVDVAWRAGGASLLRLKEWTPTDSHGRPPPIPARRRRAAHSAQCDHSIQLACAGKGLCPAVPRTRCEICLVFLQRSAASLSLLPRGNWMRRTQTMSPLASWARRLCWG